MPEDRPLDVDEGLPLPEAGQASTVVSLTALFGAYFGIALLLGLPALLGLAFGTALGLLLVRRWIDSHNPERFEAFLSGTLKGDEGNATTYALAISVVQCAYATSELLILREIAKVSFGIRPEQATMLVVGVGIIGYFYVLFGGYMAVFRTDVLQFALVGIMAAVFCVYLFGSGGVHAAPSTLLPRPGYWTLPIAGAGLPLYLYHFVIATIMGGGFLAASPDAWKRVFVVSRKKGRPGLRFLTFVSVGVLPYLMLLPFAAVVGPVPDGPVNAGQMFAKLLNNNALFVAAVSGLVASFLSSFDSALLASVHLGVVLKRRKMPIKSEVTRFHWLMVTALVSIYFLFSGLTNFSNPYLLANLLLGAYSLIAGVQVGTRGDVSRLPKNSMLWIYVLGMVGWFLYFINRLGMPSVPVTYQINTVPGGVLLVIATACVCWLLISRGRKSVRP